MGELIFAGDWLLSVDSNGKISKGVVSINDEVSPKRIRFETPPGKSDSYVMHGVYRTDGNTLQICCVMPELIEDDGDGNIELLSPAELDSLGSATAASLTDRCFNEPLREARIKWQCQRPSSSRQTPFRTLPPNVEGVILESKIATPDSRALIEISIGEDDGLREGHELSIHRKITRNGEASGIQPLGKLKLKLVTPDRAVGVVTQQHEGAKFKKGDVVTSLPQ